MSITYLIVSAPVKTKCLSLPPKRVFAGVRSRAGGGGRVKTHTIWILSHKYINELGWAPLLGGGTLSHIREGLFRTRHPCFRPQIPGSTFQAP